jgi:sugar (pentulose or hexulose) kinase
MAAATETPVSTLDTAGEGGAWGMALLATYAAQSNKAGRQAQESLAEFLDRVFARSVGSATQPDPRDVEGFRAYFARYIRGLSVERAAVEALE